LILGPTRLGSFLSFPVCQTLISTSLWRRFFARRSRKELMMGKEQEIYFKKEVQNKRLILAGFCLTVIAAVALIGKADSQNTKDRIFEDDFRFTTTDTRGEFQEADIFFEKESLFKHEQSTMKQNVPETPTPTPIIDVDISPSHSSKIVEGRATYYGIDDGYGLEDTLGCTGEPFDPYDSTTAARPFSSPFDCGDKVEVCDSDSCIEVVIKDTCPGCDDFGIVIDLSYGAMQLLSPGAGSTWVTLEEKE